MGPDHHPTATGLDPAPQRETRAGLGRRLLGALAVVSSLTVLAKGFAGAREIVVARTFGVGPDMDAFVLAFGVISLGVGVMASSLSTSVVPAFITTRDRDGEEAAARLLANALVVTLVGVAGVVVVVGLASPLLVAIVGSGFDDAQRSEAQRLLLLMLPIMMVASFGSAASGVLMADKQFARAHVGQVVNPAVVLGIVLVVGSRFGVTGLAAAMLVGFALEMAIVVVVVRRSGHSPAPRWSGYDGRTRRFVREVLPLVLAMLLANLNLLVDQAMASPLGPGSLSTMSYGSRFVALVLSLGAATLGTVALPHFSDLVSSRAWTDLRRGLVHQTLVILAVTVPLTLAVVVLSRPIVELVFVGGAFEATDVGSVAAVQAMFALQIPFYVLVILYARVLNALQMNRLFLIVTSIALVLNAVGDLALRGPLGVPGIALATTVVVIGEFVTLAVILGLALHPQRTHRLEVVPVASAPGGLGVDP